MFPCLVSFLGLIDTQGPTVFPIVFACVLGRASHAVLTWRLEKGERIGLLDILAGSTSLTSVITSQLKLRMASYLGFALVCIWALSPAGGQACLRQMSIVPYVDENATLIQMVQKGLILPLGGTDRTVYMPIVNAVFNSALLASPRTKASPLDTWGNVKMPMIEELERTSVVDSDGWLTANSSEKTVYSSLVGVPISGLDIPRAADYEFNLEVQYVHLDCPHVGFETWEAVLGPDHTSPAQNFSGPGAKIFSWENSTARSEEDPNTLKPFQFVYQDFGATKYSRCSITGTYVEAQVQCSTSSNCAVNKIRRSRLAHASEGFTLFDLGAYIETNWYIFSRQFVNALDSHAHTPTAVQRYLVAPDHPVVTRAGEYTIGDIPSNETYAIRLGQLFNTYWACMEGVYAISGGMNINTTNMTAVDVVGPSDLDSPMYGLAWSRPVNGTLKIGTEVIQAHAEWTVVLIIASLAMILASLTAPALGFIFGKGPSLMLNISSLASRDSPYIPLPESASYMDASDRARLLKHQKVRFGDVRADADVGKLAIGSLGLSGSPQIKGIQRSRLYM